MPHVYLLKCSDGSYYVGRTDNPERRLAEHQSGTVKRYTETRRPVALLWASEFRSDTDAYLCERRIKGWSRAKKEALIRGDWDAIHSIVKNERQKGEQARRAILRLRSADAPLRSGRGPSTTQR